MMPMRGSHIVAQLRTSFKRTNCGEHKWLTVSSCCTNRSNMVLCWGDTALACSQSMTEHEGTPRTRSFLPDIRFLWRATFTWELLNRLAETLKWFCCLRFLSNQFSLPSLYTDVKSSSYYESSPRLLLLPPL